MTAPTLVLDTNALDVRGFAHWLQSYRGRKVLPVVAYVELGVHYHARRRLDRLRGLLGHLGVEIEWMRTDVAERAVEAAVSRGGFAENARDFLIGAHAAEGNRVLVTNNRRDFLHLPRVVSPADLMKSRG